MGPPATRADLEAYKTKIDTLVSRATALVKNGVPENQLMAQLKTDDLGWHFNFTGDQLDHFYAELSRTKQLTNVTGNANRLGPHRIGNLARRSRRILHRCPAIRTKHVTHSHHPLALRTARAQFVVAARAEVESRLHSVLTLWTGRNA
jgi:hypothetical protein